MKNQQSKQSVPSATESKMSNGVKRFSMAGLGLGILATVSALIWLTMICHPSSSRSSTPAEIAGQMKFQDRWDAAHKEAEQKWDATLKAEAQKSDSILKATE